ncbi:MAG TPA: hypothetical protein VF160_07735 [Candidatus Dormibacteraeota bacterium]
MKLEGRQRWIPGVRLAAARVAARWWALPALLGLGIYLGLLFRTAYVYPRSSDTAWAPLLGQDLLSGNWKLSGWTLTAYPAWTTEAPAYALAIAVGGPGAWLMYVPPALFYAAAAGLAAWLATLGRGWRAALPTTLLLGLPTPYLAYLGTQPGAHMPTAAFSLAALLAFAAGLRGRWWAAAAGAVLVALAVVGDGLAVAALAAPLAGVAILAAILVRRPGFIGTAVGATVGTVTGLLVRTPTARPGGFSYIAFTVKLVGPHHWLRNLGLTWTIIVSYLGGDHPWGALAAYPAALLVGAACVAGFGVAAIRLASWRNDPFGAWLDAALLAGVAGSFGSFVLTDRPQDIWSGRYLLPAVCYVAILAGRHLYSLPGRLRYLALVAVVLLTVVRGGAFLATAAARPAVPDHAQLEAWLQDRGLSRGYGPYWDASVVTVETGGRVEVRNVEGAGGRLRPHAYLSSSRWYRPDPHRAARFVVFPAAGDDFGVDQAAAVATFGPASEVDTVGPYVVMVWDHDLAPQLSRAGA